MAHFHDKDIHHDECCEMTCSVCSQTLDDLNFQREIWDAAINGNVERVKTLLSSGVSPDAKDFAGYTALRYAARKGHYQVCETMLRHGADVDARPRSIGATSLHYASTQGHTEVNLLLEHGADANLRNADGKIPLHRVITDVDVNNLDVCKLLASVTDPTIEDNSGRTVKKCSRRTKKTIKSKKDQKEKIAHKAISVNNLIIKDNSGRTVEECLQTEKLKNQKEIAAKLKCKQILNDIEKREVDVNKSLLEAVNGFSMKNYSERILVKFFQQRVNKKRKKKNKEEAKRDTYDELVKLLNTLEKKQRSELKIMLRDSEWIDLHFCMAR